VPIRTTDADAAAIERTIGIARGRTRVLPGGVTPWLTRRAGDFFENANLWSHPALVAAASTASDDELEAVRAPSEALFLYLPALVRGLRAMLKARNPLGWGMITRADDHPENLAMIIPLLIGAQRKGMGERVQAVTDALQIIPGTKADVRQWASLTDAQFKGVLNGRPKREHAKLKRLRDESRNDTLGIKGPASRRRST